MFLHYRCSKKPFFLRCKFYIVIRASLMGALLNNHSSLPSVSDEKLLDILLYGNRRFDIKTNQNILMCTLKFIKD